MAAAQHTFTRFTGLQYLMMDIASSFGLDKRDWQERLDWFEENQEALMQVADATQDELKQNELLAAAEEPALFYAGIQAWKNVMNGKPSGYPISLDATASGMQLLSCLSGCRASAMLCNVIPTGHREDAYKRLYEEMMKAVAATGDEELKQQTGYHSASTGKGITRGHLKDAIMTSLYGSKAEPKKVFGTGALLDLFYHIMETCAPGAWQLNEALIQLWQPMAECHSWVMPDGFHVHAHTEDEDHHQINVMGHPIAVSVTVNRGTKKGISLGANITHSVDGMVVREMIARCSYDMDHVAHLSAVIRHSHFFNDRNYRPQDKMVKEIWSNYEHSGFLSGRILRFLDEENLGLVDRKKIQELIESLPGQSFRIMTIHD